MPFYYDDYLTECKFDETNYDKAVQPYYNIEKANINNKQIMARQKKEEIKFEAAELRPNF